MPGADNPCRCCPEVLVKQFPFFLHAMHQLKLPKIWRRALVVAIPKPMKPPGEAKSYRPIALLCVTFKIMGRLIYARIKPIVDPLLPQKQAGFRRGRSTTDKGVARGATGAMPPLHPSRTKTRILVIMINRLLTIT